MKSDEREETAHWPSRSATFGRSITSDEDDATRICHGGLELAQLETRWRPIVTQNEDEEGFYAA